MSTNLFKRIGASSLMGLYLCCAGVAVADDTEIFFAGVQKEGTKPNILFIMDTSGSMSWDVNGNSTNTTGLPSRLSIVQESLVELLSTVNNVNVGLARYTVPGGPIVYPVRDIDAEATPVITVKVDNGKDDVEEALNGNMNLTSVDLDLVEETGHAAWVGLRFNNVYIPHGAKVTQANLRMAAKETSSGTLDLEISGEKINNASQFTSGNANISSRTSTDAKVVWSPVSFSTVDDIYTSVNIASIIEEIVNLPGWCGGNSIVIRIKRNSAGTNSRVAYSYEQDSSLAASMKLKFSAAEFNTGATKCVKNLVTSEVSAKADDLELKKDKKGKDINDNNDSSLDFGSNANDGLAVGLLFKGINIPLKAKILDASIELVNDSSTANLGATTVNIQAADYDNFTWGSSVLSSISKTSGSDVTFEKWDTANAIYAQAGVFTKEIQSIVDRSGWVSGNNLGLILTYKSGSAGKSFYSRDASSSKMPRLKITYEGEYAKNSYTVRQELINAVNVLPASGNTPISDTLLEAGLYYKGKGVLYGATRQNLSRNRVSHEDSYTGGSHFVPSGCDLEVNASSSSCAGEVISGDPVYTSPITDTCQSNHIVFLTDGEPTVHDSRTNDTYEAWSGTTCKTGDTGRDCTVKIADYLNKKDQSDLPSDQVIRSHFISFTLTLDFLKNAATAGNGIYAEANNTAELKNEFKKILDSIKDTTSTFVSAGVTVNQTNRLRHLDQLYFSIFGPKLGTYWPGNLKRYRLNDKNVIVDQDGNKAVTTGSDQFADSARSYWSDAADGNFPEKGGVASKLTSTRKIYTSAGVTLDKDSLPLAFINTSYLLDTSNAKITKELLGVPTADDRTKVLSWARGVDVNDADKDGNKTEANKLLSDPLHSRPALVQYKLAPVIRI